jgi:cobalt-zinc-cadmium efflux system outer membrane protein
MKPFLFFLCSASFITAARADALDPAAPASDVLSLSAVTDAVLADNPSIREAHAKWQAMKQRVPQAAAWQDLKIVGTTRVARFVDVSRNSFMDQALGVEQTIPLSGQNRSRERVAAAEALVALEEARRTELDVLAKARGAYFTLAKEQALLELNRADEAALKDFLISSRGRFGVGGQTQAEVLTAENEVARVGEREHDLMLVESEAETQLSVLMNRDPFSRLGQASEMPVEAEHADFPVAQLRGALLANRPEIAIALSDVARSKALRELAGREWIPDPALTVQTQRYNYAGQAISELDVGVSMDLPWLNGKKYRAGEREAASDEEAAQQALDGARIEALGLLRDQLEKIDTLSHHLELFEKHLIPNARQALDATRISYGSGGATFQDMITAQRTLWELESTAREHFADYQMALADLDALIGSDSGILTPATETTGPKSK